MKVRILNWGFVGKELEVLGFKQSQPVTEDNCMCYGNLEVEKIEELWALVLPIYQSGLNVMFQHPRLVDGKKLKDNSKKTDEELCLTY